MSMLFSGSYDEDFMKESDKLRFLENDNQYLKKRIDELEFKLDFLIKYISENDSKFRQLFKDLKNDQ